MAGETVSPLGLSMDLEPGPEAAARARRAMARLRTDLDPPLMETLRLLVTELVTNSVRHTDTDALSLRVAVGRDAVLTEIADDGPGFEPEERDAPEADDSGWGLFLVDRLSQRWGVSHDDGRQRVWFELKRAA